MHIYNTLTRKKELFKPLRYPDVKVYQCWPTVYDYAHIGNLKTSVVEDAVTKTLEFLGYKVTTTMNITDVDDKTIAASQQAWESLNTFTQKYSQLFLEDIQKLWITLPENIQPVTEIIPEMVRMIQTMLNRGYAYLADDGSIYYSIKKYKKYGNLAHLDTSGMQESVRIDNDEYEKESAADFVLWKAWKPEDGENYWEESFSIPDLTPALSSQEKQQKTQEMILKWRPGWHIECSACAMKHFGPQIDIHMGGEDLIFPHHQNEIAQTEACTHKQFSKYWVHSGHLMVNGKKMSKSLGNFYTLRDVESLPEFSSIQKDVDSQHNIFYRAIRLWFLNGRYREQIDFSIWKLESQIATIKNLDETFKKLQRYIPSTQWVRHDFREYMQDVMQRYIVALEDDFSWPEALWVIFEYTKFVNTQLAWPDISLEEKESLIDMYTSFQEIFGIFNISLLDTNTLVAIPENILEKAQERDRAKQNKDYELADKLREEIISAWYSVQDTKDGTVVEKN